MKSGYVGVVGLPNAGKSSLVNALIGEKVSIVTDKPQTTRQKILGLLQEDELQMIFSDAPGFIQSEKGLNHFLEGESMKVMEDAHVLLAVFHLDCPHPIKFERVIETLEACGKPWVGYISKTDLEHKQRIWILERMIKEKADHVFWGSAKTGNLETHRELIECLKTYLPEQPAFYVDNEIWSPHTLRELVAESIREQCFIHLNEEIPYGTAVQIRKFEEKPNKKPQIYADLIIEKEPHKKIVIGHKGQMISTIGKESRKAIKQQLDLNVDLFLHVRIEKGWTKKNHQLKELGYAH